MLGCSSLAMTRASCSNRLANVPSCRNSGGSTFSAIVALEPARRTPRRRSPSRPGRAARRCGRARAGVPGGSVGGASGSPSLSESLGERGRQQAGRAQPAGDAPGENSTPHVGQDEASDWPSNTSACPRRPAYHWPSGVPAGSEPEADFARHRPSDRRPRTRAAALGCSAGW